MGKTRTPYKTPANKRTGKRVGQYGNQTQEKIKDQSTIK